MSIALSARVRARRAAPQLVPLLLPLLAACEGESSPVAPETVGGATTINQVVTLGPLNASSQDTLVYLSLATGKLVPVAGGWDVALRRFELRLRSAATGGAGDPVLGYAMGNAVTATDAELLAATPASTLAAFDAIRDPNLPALSAFSADRLTENRQGYLTLGGIPIANTSAYWKLKLATGGFALLRATRITFTRTFAVDSLVLESRLQVGNTLGAPRTLAIAPAGQAVAIDLTGNRLAPATGCGWDLGFDPDPSRLAITVNGACGAGSYPGAASPTFASATAANDAPQYAGFLAQLQGPIPTSVLDRAGPFRYNLAGTGRLHPTYNTFLVASGPRLYKLQVIDYYNATGAPGYPTLRVARLR
jgi:hypothetical protein